MTTSEETLQTTTLAAKETKGFSDTAQIWVWVLVGVSVILFILKCCTWCAKQNSRAEPIGLRRTASRLPIINSAAPQSLTCPQCTGHMGMMTAGEYLAALEDQQPPPYGSLPPTAPPDYNEEPPPPYSSLEQETRADNQPTCFVTQESGRS